MKIDFKNLPVIILAAGDSKRMGEPKGLLNYRGRPFLVHQIERLLEIGLSEIIVVLGKDYKLYHEKVPEFNGVEFTVNPATERGQFSSIQCGMQKIKSSTASGVFIFPIDVPCSDEEVWVELANALSSSNIAVTIPEFQGKKGHPVLISREFMQHLISCGFDTRLDFEIYKQIDLKKAKIISVNDKNITRNLNTPEDWKEYEEIK
ncbi:MAG: nucleotidyltransferase family protein [Candidatus Heimdallarchaeota archaeon]|nr:nucleotidyltransferase family protein [Candidatus Heimdallarchaeota archaeon]MCK4972483.1 nucleotidyltransferase family protein [Candidatus Heimdallarchaeota archaeon]